MADDKKLDAGLDPKGKGRSANPSSSKRTANGRKGDRPERRDRPAVRPAVQAGLECLTATLSKAGQRDVLDRLNGLETVDDILRDRPAMVPVLLTLAWQLRETPPFAPLFKGLDERTVVPQQDNPILPCELSFQQVQRTLLLGAARLAFDRQEKAWCVKRARQERERLRQNRRTEKKALHKRLMAPLKSMMTDGDEAPTPGQFRQEYPGYGLATVLKPYLSEPWQFERLELYARFSTGQARVLGRVLPRVSAPERVEWLLGLSTDDLAVVRGVCRAYARLSIGLDGVTDPTAPLSSDDPARDPAIGKRLEALEANLFDLILVNHPETVDAIRTMGLGASQIIQDLTPVFGEEIWSVVGDERALRNARSVPDHLVPVLGRVIRYVPPEISDVLLCIRNHDLVCDLMSLARETYDDETLGRYFSDPDCRSIWNTLPTKFNNAYRYQRDAQAGSGMRNYDDLCMVAKALLHSLDRGDEDSL